jgi:hypothetical protein
VEEPPADVFLSYAREDRDRIGPLVRALERHGLSVWSDRRIRPGETWEEVIGKQLRTARSVVVVWTEDSVRSSWVRAEARRAHKRDVLVPVFLDPVSEAIPMPLEEVEAADLIDWDGESESEEFDGLIAQLSEIGGVVPKEPVPPPPRPWWRRLRDRWQLVAGISIAAVLAALIWGVIAILDGNGPQPKAAIPFVDDFSSKEYGWDDVGGMLTGGHYESGTYHISAERVADGQDVMASPWNASSDANLHITVEARATRGTAEEGWAYGIFCRRDGADSFYVFNIWKDHSTLGKRIPGKSILLAEENNDVTSVKGESEKKLELVCASTTVNGKRAVELKVSVDDEMILEGTDPETCRRPCGSALESGTFGLRVALPPSKGKIGDSLDVEFDNFEVREE